MPRRVLLVVFLFVLVSAAVEAQTTREVSYNERTVVPVNAKVRFTTMIILPEHEEILDFVCGDKDFWSVSGADNFAYIKPAKTGATTNLNLVTASGGVYSFLLTEGAVNPDLKLYVIPEGPSKVNVVGEKKFYSAAQVAELRRSAEEARNEAAAAHAAAAKSADERVNAFRSSYPTVLQFPYRFKASQKPFNVAAIYTDGKFTFIRANAAELPSLYELRDGAPNLVNFQVENGVYIVPKVLENAYLAIGKQRMAIGLGR